MRGNIKMSDIARQMGVSVVTVSKALNGKEGVSKELREKIIAKTRELGYSISSAAKAVQTNNVLGILIAQRYLDHHSFYWSMFQHIQVKLCENNYFGVLEICTDEQEAALTPPKIVSEKKVENLVVIGQFSRAYLSLLTDNVENLIFIDFYDTEIDTYNILADNIMGGYKMTKYLIRRGHKDIMFVGNIHSTVSILDRAMGYVKCMLKYKKPLRSVWHISDRNEQGRYIPLNLPSSLPSAFICNNDVVAHRLVETLELAGKKVPDDVSIVSFDNYFHGDPETFITTIDFSVEKYSDALIKLLNNLKTNNCTSTIKESIYLNGTMIENHSVKDISK